MTVSKDKAGKNMSDVQEINRALVLKTIQQRQQCSRIEIARLIGLRQTTVTNIVGDLINSGIVIETSLIRGAYGRRAIGLSLNPKRYRVIGVRLTRHHILAGLFDLTGNQHTLRRVSINPERGVAAALDAMRDLLSELTTLSQENLVLGIGIGIPGPYLRDSGRIAVMADFPGWDSVSLQAELSQSISSPIFIEYDAYAGALAEWWLGRHYETNSVLLSVRMEQGLGAGVVQDGAIFSGAQGIAGNIGHMSIDYQGIPCECGSRGCLRNYCTANAVLNDISSTLKNPHVISTLKGTSPLTLDAVLLAANAGDVLAKETLMRSARYLGYGLINTIYAYNPDIIVLSEEFSAAGEWYLNEIRSVLTERLRPAIADKIRLQFSSLRGDVVLTGATTLVIDRILQSPSQYFSFS